MDVLGFTKTPVDSRGNVTSPSEVADSFSIPGSMGLSVMLTHYGISTLGLLYCSSACFSGKCAKLSSEGLF